MIRYLVVIFALVLFFMAIFMIKDEKISRKNKVILSFIFVVFLMFAYFFQSIQDSKNSQKLENLKAFNQGKTLVCSDINVTNDKFNYEFGTSCFLPKREFKELSGLVIKILDCKVR